MFDGVPADQFHQFITPTRTSPSSLPLHHHHHHLPFPTTLHPPNTNANTTTNNNNTTFPPPFVDPYNHHNNPSHHHHHHQLITNNLLHPAAAPLHPPHHHSSSSSSIVHNNHEEKEENNNNTTTLPMMNNFEIDERDRQINRRQHQQLPELIDPWSNEEVLTLLRIRSTMDSTWFPELTCWEHVSRKMAEFGYKRSAEKCKEKFEEESRYFNNINNNNNNYGKSSSSSYNNNRFLSELEELYHHHQEVVESEKNHHHQNNNNPSEGQEEGKIIGHHALLEGEKEEDGGSRKVNVTPAAVKEKENDEEEIRTNNNKRKRGSGGGGGRFEMFKGFCERIVHKMMKQQEEMHNKLIEDMVRWDEEKFAREEAWKRQEIEKMNKELEIMAQEQATAGNRHAGIIDFLRKFYPEINQGLGIIGTSDSDNGGRDKLVKVTTNVSGSNTNLVTAAAAATSASSELHSHQNPNPSTMENSPLQQTNSSAVVTLNPIQVAKENPSSSGGTHPAQDTLLQVGNKNPSSSSSLNNDPNPIETNSVVNKAISNRVVSTTTITGKDDIGRRWPKDEVLALINLRCTTQNNNNNNNEDNNNTNNNNNNKAPLWERISQGMLELGYKRSAKRCKEKWENINKYFRKTKDNVNKKRSLDSRTCPYFHYLSNLYSQGKVVLQSPPPPKRQQEIVPASMHRISSNPEVNNNSQANNNNNHGNVVVRDGIRNQTQLVDETSSSQVGSGGGGGFSVQQQQEVDHGGEKTLMQVPSLEFDQF